MQFQYCALTDIGSVRGKNEDAVAVDAHAGVAVLADGMGGYKAGEVASSMAVQLILSELRQRLANPLDLKQLQEAVRSSIEVANLAILKTASTTEACAGMGSTVVTGVIQGEDLVLGHVGDSRAYLWRRGTLTQLTRDHSWLQELLDAGLADQLPAGEWPFRSVVTRALGMGPNVMVDTAVHRIKAGDTVLLCSDGLSGMVNDAEMSVVLSRDQPGEVMARTLVDMANEHGGMDNISVVLVRTAA